MITLIENQMLLINTYIHIYTCINLVVQSSPTATFVNPGRSMRVKFTTAGEKEQMLKTSNKKRMVE